MKSINTLPALPSGMESRGCQPERASSQSLDSILRTGSWLRACGCNFGDVNPPPPPHPFLPCGRSQKPPFPYTPPCLPTCKSAPALALHDPLPPYKEVDKLR